MALPTGNLTFHGTAAVNTDLWTTNTAGVFSVHPADNGLTSWMDDVEHADICAGPRDANVPTWRSSVPLMPKPCLDFDGTNDSMKFFANDGTTAKALSALIAAGAWTVFASIWIEGVVTSSVNAYNNESIISDGGTFWGVHLRNNGGAYSLQFYNWDGAEKKVTVTVSLATPYYFMWRFDGSNMYVSLNGAAESAAVASGNCTDRTGIVTLGDNSPLAKFYNGRLGEIALYNTNLSGASLSDGHAWFGDWLPRMGKNYIHQQAVKRASFY